MSRRSDPYRSGLERRIGNQLDEAGIEFGYEPFKIPFVHPAEVRRYTPDFVLPNGIIVEAKGRWTTADRKKFVLLKRTYPTLDVRFVFSNANTKISRQSKTTYAKYCQSHGWPYSTGVIPIEWLKEEPTPERMEFIERFLAAPINRRKLGS